jgi:glycosyltransferase involved in cell wall biosynthesis
MTTPKSHTRAPTIAYVMPVRNDARYLRTAVESIVAQKNPKGTEIIVAIGPSEDKTRVIAEELAQEYPLVILDNPSGGTSAALNIAMLATNADVLIRVDAHSELEPGYTKLAVSIVQDTNASNVGGIMEARGHSSIQKAVAWAYGNFIGLGGGPIHTGGVAGPADTVYLGVLRRLDVLEVGGFNEALVRGQDWELNARLRESGKLVWFDPRLTVGYYPRRDIMSLARQFFTTGTFRAYILLANPKRTRTKYLVPPTFILSAVTAAALFLATFNWVWLAPLYAYAAVVLGGAWLSKGLSLKSRIALMAVLPTMHISWGLGFWRGVFTFRSRGDDVPLNTAAISVHS